MNTDFKMNKSISDFVESQKSKQIKGITPYIKGLGVGDKDNKPKVRKAIDYVIGSIAIYAAAWVFIPEVMTHISGKINKIVTKSSNRKHENDDWGPEIVKKSNKKE